MKTKKGFTLIELLAVIAILGTIISIVTISAIKVSNTRREQDYANIKNIVVTNTKSMVEANYEITDQVDEKVSSSKKACKVSYATLVNDNIMDNDITNPVDEKNKPIKNTCVKITMGSNYEYKYEFIEDVSVCNSLDECYIKISQTQDDDTPSGNVEYVYPVQLDNQGAQIAGTTAIYMKKNDGFYLDQATTKKMTTSSNTITKPTKIKNTFNGYYTETDGKGTKFIDANGKLTSSASSASTINTLYAYWTTTSGSSGGNSGGTTPAAKPTLSCTLQSGTGGGYCKGTYTCTCRHSSGISSLSAAGNFNPDGVYGAGNSLGTTVTRTFTLRGECIDASALVTCYSMAGTYAKWEKAGL